MKATLISLYPLEKRQYVQRSGMGSPMLNFTPLNQYDLRLCCNRLLNQGSYIIEIAQILSIVV